MGFRSNRVLGGMVCVLALSALQMAYADDAEVKLARTFKEKDTYRYKEVIKTNVVGMDAVLTTVTKDTVKEIKQTGETVMLRETESSKLELGGAEQGGQKNSPVTYTVDKSGKLTEWKPEMDAPFFDPGISRLLEVAHHIVFPDKAVKKDDKWETEVDNPAVKGKKMTVKETYLGTEKRDGKDLWKIKLTLDAPVDDAGGKTTFELTSLLDPENGQVMHSEGSVKDLPTTQVGAITWTETTDFVKPGDDKKVADADKKQ